MNDGKLLAESICLLAGEVRKLRRQMKESNNVTVVLKAMEKMEERIVIKVSEVKTAVANAAKQNKEAFQELGTRVADLQKQIDDLIAANADPSVDDATFEADLRDLAATAKSLADIVPGSPTPEPPAGPTT